MFELLGLAGLTWFGIASAVTAGALVAALAIRIARELEDLIERLTWWLRG